MVAQLTTNSNTTLQPREDLIKFQYNPTFSSYSFKDKDLMKLEFKKNRASWVLESGLNSLINRLDEGFTVQAGINQVSTVNDDIESIDWFYIDYDAWDKAANAPIPDVATIDELLQLSFISEFCSFYQTSFSYREEAPNLHFIFLLSRLVTKTEQQIIIKCFSEHLKEEFGKSGFDPSIENNPGQVMFAGKEKCHILNDSTVVVDVEMWLELGDELGYRAEVEAKEARAKANKNGSKKFSPNNSKPPESNKQEPEEAIESFTQKLFSRIQKEIIEGVLENDVTGLFCLFEHNWFSSNRNLNGGLAQWDGSNPFSPTNSNGDSLTITLKYEDLPPQFYDRSNNFKGRCQHGINRTGGSIIDYWFTLGNDLKGNRFWTDEDEQNKSIEEKEKACKLRFTDVCDSLFNHFGLKYRTNKGLGNSKKKEFEQKINEVVEDCREYFKGKVFFYGKDNYFLYVESNGCWSTEEGGTYIYGLVFSAYIAAKYGHFVAENGKVREAVISAFRNSNTITNNKIPKEDYNYLAFQNGLLNKNTKEFKINDGSAYNRNVLPYEFDFEKVPTDDNPIIQKFFEHWKEWLNSDIKGQLLIDWLILCVQFRAWESEKMLGLIGASGKGKTTYCTLINALINGASFESDKWTANGSGYASKPSSSRLTGSYAHATAVLEGKMHVHLEELKGGYGENAPNILKELSGNSANRTLTINPKGQKERQIPFYAGITFDCEKMIKIPNEQGYFRRIVFITIDETAKAPDSTFNYFYENIETILHWCVMQDGKEVLRRFLENTKHMDIQEDVKDIRLENDSLAQFITDNYELTDSAEDKMPLESIYLLYSNTRKIKGYGAEYESQKRFGITFKTKLKDASLGFNWLGDTSQVGKTKKTVYTHLKLLKNVADNF